MQLGPSGTQQTLARALVLNNGGATWRQVDAAARGEKAVNLTPPIEKGGRPPGGDGGRPPHTRGSGRRRREVATYASIGKIEFADIVAIVPILR
jgi:hypothetical protein